MHLLSASTISLAPACEPVTWRPSVGDAVRVVLADLHACAEAPHLDCELGRTGRILRSSPVAGAPAHPYLVKLDQPDPEARLSRLGAAIVVRHYAADELEPLI